MALIATPGGSTSNSYLTLDRADEIAAQHPFAAPWIAIVVTATKEALLIHATRLINYRVCYLGSAVTATQALKFPRLGLLTSTGYALSTTIIPVELELATFELALALIASNVALQSSAAVEGLIKLKAGPVELGFKSGIEFQTIPEHVKALLPSAWLCPDPSTAVRPRVIAL